MMTGSTIASAVLAVIADASLKVTVVLAAAGLWTLLDRSASAAIRHLVSLVALGSALVLPAIVPFAPAWRVSLPLPDRPWADERPRFVADEAVAVVADVVPATVEWSASEQVAVTVPSAAGPIDRADAAPAAVVWVASGPPVERIAGDELAATFAAGGAGPQAFLVLAWLAGVVAMATPRVRARLRLRRIEESAAPVESLRVRGETRAVAAAMGLTRAVRLLEGSDGSMPMTWGVFRPVVLLPADAWTWSPERLRAVLRHELAHVARMDALAHSAAEIACVLHWFNPFVWYGAKRLRVESEHACDDRVLAHGGDPADYAAELVDLARSLRPARAAALAGMAMARGRSLRGRLIALLDGGRDRRPVSALDALRAVAVAMLVVLPLACLAPAAPAVERAGTRTPRAVPGVGAWPESEPGNDGPGSLQEPRSAAPQPAPAQRQRPDADLTARVLRQAAEGLGDRELADLLAVAAGTGGISNDATRAAFLDAARTIGSDRDRARALDAWLATRPDEAGLIALVDVAAGIGSDREAASVLERTVGVRAVTPSLREAVLRALDGVGSERERRRVVTALDGTAPRR